MQVVHVYVNINEIHVIKSPSLFHKEEERKKKRKKERKKEPESDTERKIQTAKNVCIYNANRSYRQSTSQKQ